MHRLGRLTVKLSDFEQRPVPRAFVTFVPVTQGLTELRTEDLLEWPRFDVYRTDREAFEIPRAWKALTDNNGIVVFEPIPTGYSLRIRVEGHFPTALATTDLGACNDSQSVEIDLAQTCGLAGRITWSNGRPASGLRIIGRDSGLDSDYRSIATTSSSGEFRATGLAPGLCRWRIDSPGESVRISEIVAPETNVGEVVLPSRERLQGRLVYQSFPVDHGLSALRVRVQRDGLVFGDKYADSAGHFDFYVPSGRSFLQVLISSFVLLERVVDAPSPPLEVVLDGHDAVLQLVDVPSCSRIALRLQPAAAIGSLNDDPHCVAQYSSTEHARLLHLQGGCATLVLQPPGLWDSWVRFDDDRWRFLGQVPLVQSEMTTRSLASTILNGGIAGRVLDGAGHPLAAVDVGIVPVSDPTGRAGSPEWVRSRPDGLFDFGALPVQDYLVFPLRWGATHTSTVRVHNDAGRTTDITLRIDQIGNLRITARRKGEGVPSVTFQLRPLTTPYAPRALLEVRSDTHGMAAVAGLPVGEYEVNAIPPQVATGASTPCTARSVIVAEGAPTSVEFDLDAISTPLRFWHAGEHLRGLDHVAVYWQGGRSTPIWDSVGELYRAILGTGKHTCCLGTIEDSAGDGMQGLMQYRFASFTGSSHSSSPIDVVVHGVSLTVSLTDATSSTLMPYAVLVSLPEQHSGMASMVGQRLFSIDTASHTRTFPDVPVGTHIRLVDPSPSRSPSKDLTISTSLVLPWP